MTAVADPGSFEEALAMDPGFWIALYDSIPIKTCRRGKPLPKPTDQLIAAFEQRSHCKLPTGYKDYIKVFGPGELAWEYQILAPGYADQGDLVDLELFNRKLHSVFTDDFLVHRADPDQVVRMLYFCRTGSGEAIGWDPLDVQDCISMEYGIYLLARDDRSLRKLADSYEDFIEDVCLGNENINIPGWDEGELGPRRSFEPVCEGLTEPS
jgi:hypothetical protein